MMRDFLLKAPELLDREAMETVNSLADTGLIPCKSVRVNEKVRLVYCRDAYEVLADVFEALTMEEIRDAAGGILRQAQAVLETPGLYLENLILDMDSIYLENRETVHMICLPAVMHEDTLQDQISAKRLYTLLEEMFEDRPGGEETARQIRYQKEKSFGDWGSLAEALHKRTPEEYEALLLRSVNTPRELLFRVGHENFVIGSETGEADGLILGMEGIAPCHAEIGWNEIGYYVKDLGSLEGTYVNDQKITPDVEIPIGMGTVLRFAGCTFTVE